MTENNIKSFFLDIRTIIILISWLIIAILLLTRGCNRNNNSADCPKIDTTMFRKVIVLKTVHHDTIINKPYPIYRDTGSIKVIIDSLSKKQLQEIAKLFYTKNYYHTILRNDSNYFAEIYYSVNANEMQLMRFIDSLKYKVSETTINTKIINPDRFKLYLGVGVSLNPFDANVYPDLNVGTIMTYRRLGLNVNYGLFHKSLNAGVYYKISFRKK